MSARRRKVPLTSFASARPRHRAAGDRSCSGGAPARRTDGVHLLGRSAAMVHNLVVVVGSGHHLGHKNPASSRAIAAATMDLVFLRAARARNRADRRSCAGDHLWVQPELAAGNRAAHTRSMPVGPGRPRPVARAGGRCRPWSADRRGPSARWSLFAWDQAAEPHELGRSSEPAPVAHRGRRPAGRPGRRRVGGPTRWPGPPRPHPAERGGWRPPPDSGPRWSPALARRSAGPQPGLMLGDPADPPRHTRP